MDPPQPSGVEMTQIPSQMLRTGFSGQLNALLRKNVAYQKRRPFSNACIIALPVFFVLVLMLIQMLFDDALDKNADTRCGCVCLQCCREEMCRTEENGGEIICSRYESCSRTDCGPQYSNSDQIAFCSIDHPSTWPPVLTIPEPSDRAQEWIPDVVFMIAGLTSSTRSMLEYFFPPFDELKAFEVASDRPDYGNVLSNTSLTGEWLSAAGLYLGSPADTSTSGYLETAFISADLAALSQDCKDFPEELVDQYTGNIKESIGERLKFAFEDPDFRTEKEYLQCVDSPIAEFPVAKIERRLFCSYKEARCDGKISLEEQRLLKETEEQDRTKIQVVEKYPNAWDFTSTNTSYFSSIIWYDNKDQGDGPIDPKRLNLPQNMASTSWVKWILGDEYSSRLLALQEVPKPASQLRLEISSLLAMLFFTWIAQLLLPMMLVQLVYERENGLRIMMKIHGLSDQAYWTISYLYYYIVYIVYISVFLLISTLAGLAVITENDYGVTCVFFFLFGHVQIGFAAILGNLFRSSATASTFGFLWVLGCGLVGQFLVNLLIRRSRWYVYLIEIIPGFSVYRGIYELSQYGFVGAYSGEIGLTWSKFGDDNNHMQYILIVLLVEWPLFLLIAWYLEQVVGSGVGIQRHPLFFLDWLTKGPGKLPTTEEEVYTRNTSSSSIQIDTESNDVRNERTTVRNMQPSDLQNYGIVVNGLHKQFPGQDGNRPKVAVHDLAFAVRKGEVFGLLGPNGAGKTTSINMLIGFMPPTSGHAQVSGYDIRTDMDRIYSLMGVCPQHNLLWDVVTGYEHLLFYGRMKGLKGKKVIEAAASALQSVNLVQSGHKQVKTYSGGMKRRLSVAISLIGTPDVVFLDEPSTGLDPASRKNLWKVVAAQKRDKSIILTTHSMEEAEVLCDRLGIFVAGRLVALGNPKDLIAQHGGYRVFTLMTKREMVEAAASWVMHRFPDATAIPPVGGTLKFELPAKSVRHSDVFAFVETIKQEQRFEIEDWGVTDVTLEDVFIKVAKDAGVQTSSTNLAID